MENLKKTVVVTGASFGIGKATAKLLAENNFHVIAIARSIDELKSIESDNIEVYQMDITNRSEVENFGKHIYDRKIDALVNNAGGGFNLPNNIITDDVDHWKKSYDLNVVGAMHMTKIVAPSIIKNGGGNVVLVTSMAGHFVYRGGSSYTVAKHAEVALAEILRFELFDKNIRVTEIAPGNVNSRGDRDRNNCLNPEDVADAIRWSLMVPEHVNIETLSILHINNLSR
jgi:short-subunit dehydrogenase